jgi:hypothetical protein
MHWAIPGGTGRLQSACDLEEGWSLRQSGRGRRLVSRCRPRWEQIFVLSQKLRQKLWRLAGEVFERVGDVIDGLLFGRASAQGAPQVAARWNSAVVSGLAGQRCQYVRG